MAEASAVEDRQIELAQALGLIVPVRLPGRAARVLRAGANLAPDQAVGHRSWEEFLAARVS